MSKHFSLLRKEIAVHKKIFLLIPYIAIMLFFASKMNILPLNILNHLLFDLNFFIPAISLFLVKIEENQSLGLNSLLITMYQRRDILISRYCFTLLLAVLVFLVNEITIFVCSITEKGGANKGNFSLFYLGCCFLVICVLSSIMLFLNFSLAIVPFSILAMVITFVLSQIVQFLIIFSSFKNFFGVEIFAALGIISLFLYATELVFNKKNL